MEADARMYFKLEVRKATNLTRWLSDTRLLITPTGYNVSDDYQSYTPVMTTVTSRRNVDTSNKARFPFRFGVGEVCSLSVVVILMQREWDQH